MLKWEYRCRALEQEAAGLQQRNAALTADLKLEFKESKRSSKVVSTMLGALVEARQALMKLDAGADTSALDAALRFALSGKEVVWPDQSQDARRRDENSGPRNTSAFASPKPGKASQSLCVASPDQLHTPTHAEARARAPMRSVSRSISRSKLSSSTGEDGGRWWRHAPCFVVPCVVMAHSSLPYSFSPMSSPPFLLPPAPAVSAIPSPAGTPSRIPTPSKSASGRKKRRSPAMMATPLELRTPSHWAVPQATGKLSSTPVPQAPAPAPEEPAELANVLPTLRCSAVRPDPSKTHTKAAGGRRGLRRSNSTPALNMTAALESASDDALPPKRRATRTKMARQASASRLGRTFTASPVQRLPVIESPAPAAKSAAGGDDSDNDDANSTFTMEDQPVGELGSGFLGRAWWSWRTLFDCVFPCFLLAADEQPAEAQQLFGQGQARTTGQAEGGQGNVAGQAQGGAGDERCANVVLGQPVCNVHQADQHAVQGARMWMWKGLEVGASAWEAGQQRCLASAWNGCEE